MESRVTAADLFAGALPLPVVDWLLIYADAGSGAHSCYTSAEGALWRIGTALHPHIADMFGAAIQRQTAQHV